jgi:hypothetical protein
MTLEAIIFWGPPIFIGAIGALAFVWRRPRNEFLWLAPLIPLALNVGAFLVATTFQGAFRIWDADGSGFVLLGGLCVSVPVGIAGMVLLLLRGTVNRKEPRPEPVVPEKVRVCRRCGREMNAPFCPHCS